MKNLGRIIIAVIIVGGVFFFSNSKPLSNERVISEFLKGANSSKKDILASGEYKAVDIRQDGKNFGVNFTFTFSMKIPVMEKKDRDELQKELIKGMKDDPNIKKMKKIFNRGFYILYTYKSSDGTTVATARLDKSNLF